MANITGTNGNDSLVGTSVADTISGLDGNDTLVGNAGNDTLNGGAGNDRYVVGTGDVLTDSSGTDTIETAITWHLAAGLENLIATGTANTSHGGNNLANQITGNAGSNWIAGREGDDTLNGGGGADTFNMSNGAGASYGTDYINGGDGVDTIDFGAAARSAIHINLLSGYGGGGGTDGAGWVQVTNVENVNGSAFDDTITGNAAANFLYGYNGNDTLDGGAGNDRLEGAAGNDRYILAEAPGAANADTLVGFASGADEILIDGLSVLNLGTNGEFAPGDARFAAGAGFTSGRDATDRIIYNTTTGQLFYDGDGSGAGAAQLIATLQGAPALAATDIAVRGSAEPAGINGTEGDDSLAGGAGDDTINGLGGNDTINGAGGRDVLSGGSGNDLISGGDEYGEAADSYFGGDGDDTLDGAVWAYGGSAPDTMDGGLGNDLYYVDHSDDVLSDAGGTDSVYVFDRDWTLGAGFENLHINNDYSEGPATGIGNELDNVISLGWAGGRLEGRGGDDTLTSGTRESTLLGGDGNDVLSANGYDTLDGGAGDDTLSGGYLTTGGAGADSFLFDTFYGGTITDFASGVDRIRLDGRTITEVGASGTFAAGDARFYAAAGASGGHDADDRIIHDTSSGQLLFDRDGSGSEEAFTIAWLNSGTGASALAATDITIDHGATTATGTAGNDSLVGESGNDSISGLAGNDTLIGLEGHDTLDGGAGVDRLEGGTHNDTYYVTSGDVVIETPDWSGGDDTAIANVSWTLGEGLENLELLEGAVGAIQGTGNAGRNRITGNSANNVLDGGGGDDNLYGGAGNDTLTGTGSISGEAGDDLLIGGTYGNLTGGHGNDRLEGGSYASGESGNDTLVGGDGPSELVGGAGSDTFLVAPTWHRYMDFTSGDDELRFDGQVFAQIGASGDFAAGDERFYAAAGANAGHDATDRVVYNTETGELWYDADGSGSEAALAVATLRDWRFGAPTANVQATDIAVDNGTTPPPPPTSGQTLNGTTDNDTLTGGAGNDTINGLAGADLLQGLGGNDSIVGAAGWDTIQGGDGDDRLHAGAWSDTMTGGAGADSFVWTEAGSNNRDTVTDFASGTDELLFENGTLTAMGGAGAWAAGDARFWAAAGATSGHDGDDRLIYNTTTGNLYYDADGSGAGAAQVVATFTGSPGIVATDITVI